MEVARSGLEKHSALQWKLVHAVVSAGTADLVLEAAPILLIALMLARARDLCKDII